MDNHNYHPRNYFFEQHWAVKSTISHLFLIKIVIRTTLLHHQLVFLWMTRYSWPIYYSTQAALISGPLFSVNYSILPVCYNFWAGLCFAREHDDHPKHSFIHSMLSHSWQWEIRLCWSRMICGPQGNLDAAWYDVAIRRTKDFSRCRIKVLKWDLLLSGEQRGSYKLSHLN